MRRNRSLVLLALLLGGCAWFARWKAEPTALPFPPPPHLTFLRCDTDKVCLSQADATLLAGWMDKLRAFQSARTRLLAE